MNLNEMTDAALRDLADAVEAEQYLRTLLASAESQITQITTQVLEASGREPGSEWQAPAGAHDAYPQGWTVTKDGVLYTSDIPGNHTTPGPDARYWTAQKDPDTGPGEWAAGTYYKVGDLVTRHGVTYKCTHEHLGAEGWEPGNPGMHAVWKLQP